MTLGQIGIKLGGPGAERGGKRERGEIEREGDGGGEIKRWRESRRREKRRQGIERETYRVRLKFPRL